MPDTDMGPGTAVTTVETHRPVVLTRDFLTFAAKLLVNAGIEVVMLPLAAVAYAGDVLTRRSGEDSWFYAVLKLGRRWDAWLRLFRPASRLTSEPAPILKSATTGADQLIASVEHLIATGDLPTRYRDQVKEWSTLMKKTGEPEGDG